MRFWWRYCWWLIRDLRRGDCQGVHVGPYHRAHAIDGLYWEIWFGMDDEPARFSPHGCLRPISAAWMAVRAKDAWESMS